MTANSIRAFKVREIYRPFLYLAIALVSAGAGILVSSGSAWASLSLGFLMSGLLIFFSLRIHLEYLISIFLVAVLALPLTNPVLPELGTIQIIGFTVHIYELVLLLLFGSWIARLAIGQLRFFWSSLYLPVGILLVWIVFGLAAGLWLTTGKAWLGDMLVWLPYVVLLPATLSAFTKPYEQAGIVIKAIILGLALNGIFIAAVLLMGPDSWVASLIPPATVKYRMGTSAGGVFLWGILLVAQITLFTSPQADLMQLMTWVGAIPFFFAVIIGMSRTTWTTGVLSVVVLMLIYLRRQGAHIWSQLLKILIALVAITGLVAIVLSILFMFLYGDRESIIESLSGRLTVGFEDIDWRLEFYRLALPLVQQYPFGTGPGSMWIYANRPVGFFDNIYLTILLKFGYLGLFIFIVWIGILLSLVARSRKMSRRVWGTDGGTLVTVIQVGLPATLVLGLNTAWLLYNRPLAVTLAILVGWLAKLTLDS